MRCFMSERNATTLFILRYGGTAFWQNCNGCGRAYFLNNTKKFFYWNLLPGTGFLMSITRNARTEFSDHKKFSISLLLNANFVVAENLFFLLAVSLSDVPVIPDENRITGIAWQVFWIVKKLPLKTRNLVEQNIILRSGESFFFVSNVADKRTPDPRTPRYRTLW